MSDFTIDPTRGPHAAAELTDEELTYLAKIVAWEVAIRTSSEYFTRRLTELADSRAHMQSAIESLRRERDLMRFAAEVTADIEQLPVVEEETSYGLYL